MVKLTLNVYNRYMHYLSVLFDGQWDKITRARLGGNRVSLSTVDKDLHKLGYEYYGGMDRLELSNLIIKALNDNPWYSDTIYTVVSTTDKTYAYSTTIETLALIELRSKDEDYYIVESKNNYY